MAVIAAPSRHPSVNTLTLDSFDPETMDEAVHGSSFDHTQLQPGRFQASLLRGQMGASWLDSGKYSLPLLAVGEMPSDKITLGYVINTVDRLGYGVLNGQKIERPSPVLLTERAELRYRLPEHSPWLAFQVPRKSLEQTDAAVPYHCADLLNVAQETSIDLQRELSAALQALRTIAVGHPDIPDPIAFLADIQARLLDAFSATMACLSTTGHGRTGNLFAASRLVRQATDLIRANLNQPLRIGAICLETGSDWKKLERAFLSVHGVTPKRFLTLVRLTQARRLLIRSSGKQSITGVATSCGIHHLGRFSQEYCRLFGERPSDTLARSGKSK